MRGLGTAIMASLAIVPRAKAEPAIPPVEPVVAVDDTRTHAPVLFEGYQLGATYRYLFHGANSDLVTAQVGIGPAAFDEIHTQAVLGWMRNYSFRVRATATDVFEQRRWGPLTLAITRYLPVEPLAIAPLLYLHLGIETAVSTPWASGRHDLPPDAIGTAMNIDTELASNGWSLRPASAYVRADLLLCRSIAMEVGAGPEAFVPTVPNARTEYDVRFHALFGISFACVHERDSWWKNLDAVIEYRGRAKLYSGDAPPNIFSETSLELQHRGKLTYGAFISTNIRSFLGVGLRLQMGGQ